MSVGKDRSGIERSGIEMSGIEMSGSESGIDKSGSETSELETSELETSEVDALEVASLGTPSFLSLLQAETPSSAAAPMAKTATDFMASPFGVRESDPPARGMSEQGLQILDR